MVVLSNPELVMQVQGRSTFRGVVLPWHWPRVGSLGLMLARIWLP